MSNLTYIVMSFTYNKIRYAISAILANYLFANRILNSAIGGSHCYSLSLSFNDLINVSLWANRLIISFDDNNINFVRRAVLVFKSKLLIYPVKHENFLIRDEELTVRSENINVIEFPKSARRGLITEILSSEGLIKYWVIEIKWEARNLFKQSLNFIKNSFFSICMS